MNPAWKRLPRLTGLVVAALTLTGCLSIYKVHDSQEKKLKGIPFYPKTAVCEQTTLYTQMFAQVALYRIDLISISADARTASGAKAKEVETLVGSKNLGLDAVRRLLQDAEPGVEPDKAEKLISDFHCLNEFTPCRVGCGDCDSCEDLILARNASSVKTIVNYEEKHYYNVRRPWLGSASSTLELGQDGSLSKATAEVEDTTLSTILDLLPITGFLERELDLDAASGDEDAQAAAGSGDAEKSGGRRQELLRLRLVVKPLLAKHELVKTRKCERACGEHEPLAFDLAASGAAAYSLQIVDAGSGGAKKKSDQPTIGISGEILLPKEKKEAKP